MKAKKFLAAVLACSIMFGATTTIGAYEQNSYFVAAAADIVDSGKCGENAVWTLDSEGTMTISGTAMKNIALRILLLTFTCPLSFSKMTKAAK